MFFEAYECDIVSYTDDNPLTHVIQIYIQYYPSQKTLQIVCSRGLRNTIWNQMVISVSSSSKLKNQIDGSNVKNNK